MASTHHSSACRSSDRRLVGHASEDPPAEYRALFPELGADLELVANDIDLAHSAVQYRELQQQVDQHNQGALYGPSALLDKALWRYVNVWLPLLAKCPESAVIPPLDVMWVWLCHMLAPIPYYHDCVRGFGKLLPRTVLRTPGAVQLAKCSSRTTWELHSTEPWDPPGPLDNAPEPVHYSSFRPGVTDGRCVHYNIRGSANRQAQACWNMSRPQFGRAEWHRHSVVRYVSFLRLQRHKQDAQDPWSLLTPTYDIDCVWHAHMSYPQLYAAHTEQIAGHRVNHDDGFNDRGGKLDEAASVTQELWLAKLGVPYWRAGGMYRNFPRPGFDCEDYPVSKFAYPAGIPQWTMGRECAELQMGELGPRDLVIADRWWAQHNEPSPTGEIRLSVQAYAVRHLPFSYRDALPRGLSVCISLGTQTVRLTPGMPPACFASTEDVASSPHTTIQVELCALVGSSTGRWFDRCMLWLKRLIGVTVFESKLGKPSFIPTLPVLKTLPARTCAVWLPLSLSGQDGGHVMRSPPLMLLIRVAALPGCRHETCSELETAMAQETTFLELPRRDEMFLWRIVVLSGLVVVACMLFR